MINHRSAKRRCLNDLLRPKITLLTCSIVLGTIVVLGVISGEGQVVQSTARITCPEKIGVMLTFDRLIGPDQAFQIKEGNNKVFLINLKDGVSGPPTLQRSGSYFACTYNGLLVGNSSSSFWVRYTYVPKRTLGGCGRINSKVMECSVIK